MGFLRGNKTEAERIEDERVKILNEGQVLIDLAVGTHGADEVIAGAMMGETGKYWQWQSMVIQNGNLHTY